MQPSQNNDQTIGQEIKQDTKSIGSAAANRIHSEVDSRKEGGISQIQEVSSALKKTAAELGDNSPNWLKSAIEQGADQITKFASTLEQKDSRQLASDVRLFAQQSPGTFLAACTAAGFAASRIFKAGTPGNHSEQTNDNSYSDEFSSTPFTQPAPTYPGTQA